MSKTSDIWEIYRWIPGASIPDGGWSECPEMCNDEWFFAEAIVDLIDRKVKEQTQ